MGRVKGREAAAKAQAKREDTIKKALNVIRAGAISLRDEQSAFEIPSSTLSDRMRGAKQHFVAHFKQQKLTPTDGKAVIRLITRLKN